jgi:hypothetical protein
LLQFGEFIFLIIQTLVNDSFEPESSGV